MNEQQKALNLSNRLMFNNICHVINSPYIEFNDSLEAICDRKMSGKLYCF